MSSWQRVPGILHANIFENSGSLLVIELKIRPILTHAVAQSAKILNPCLMERNCEPRPESAQTQRFMRLFFDFVMIIGFKP